MAPKKKAPSKRVRSAITGQFEKKSKAKTNPRTTVTETVKPRKGKPKKGK